MADFEIFDISKDSIEGFCRDLTTLSLNSYYVFFKDVGNYFLKDRIKRKHTWNDVLPSIIHELNLVFLELKEDDFYNDCNYCKEIGQNIARLNDGKDNDKTKKQLLEHYAQIFEMLDNLENKPIALTNFSKVMEDIGNKFLEVSNDLNGLQIEKPKTQNGNTNFNTGNFAALILSLPLLLEFKN